MGNQSEKSQKGNTSNALVLAILSSVPLIMVLGNSMLIPVLPTIESSLGISSFQVSLLITLFSIPAGVIIPVAGILSDRYGRKPVIAPALLLYGAGGLLTGFASIWGGGIYWLMLTGRILQGLGAAGTAPITMALVSDLYKKDERSSALGTIEAANGLGKVVSPILGSLIALITWYALFFTFPVLTVPIALALWFFVKEPEQNRNPQPLSQYKENLTKTWKRQGGWLLVAFLAGALTLFIMFGVLFFLSDLLEKRYKIDGVLKGLILAIPLLAMSSTSLWAGRHVKQKTRTMKRFIVVGLFIVAIGMGIVPFVSNTYVLMADLVGIGIGSGLILPCLNTLITSSVGSKERGIITSLYNGVRFLGVALGPPIFGALMDSKYVLYLGNAGLSALTGILAIWAIKKPERLKNRNGRSRLYMGKNRLKPS
ncbi:MFS transporter, ACDE family, multidrug resistance protein [Melghirimyces thermohalophilus]|uniref:MFS transporter, ACDE family, multidrug resistance protein n=1 Tax=Melghirimyces thermohalophilus TaxID=1236220 RepID=A0A1G6Q8C4_9BACL|nr:MFS transporter [Melghirimyces thermohalophilus]SDC88589.1 MFS transporter, ACDE family, multidrug resistance protein [Melghirimyces thermohalophilus]